MGGKWKQFCLLSKICVGSRYWFHLKITLNEDKKKKRQNPLNFLVTDAIRDNNEEKLLKQGADPLNNIEANLHKQSQRMTAADLIPNT